MTKRQRKDKSPVVPLRSRGDWGGDGWGVGGGGEEGGRIDDERGGRNRNTGGGGGEKEKDTNRRTDMLRRGVGGRKELELKLEKFNTQGQ